VKLPPIISTPLLSVSNALVVFQSTLPWTIIESFTVLKMSTRLVPERLRSPETVTVCPLKLSSTPLPVSVRPPVTPRLPPRL